ncbi:ribbon-helix-helix protein, CopG family, partial [Turicimonas muris]
MERLSITVDKPIADAFQKLIEKRGYKNRSEAFRDLLRNELAKESLLNPEQECVAVVSYAFDHE